MSRLKITLIGVLSFVVGISVLIESRQVIVTSPQGANIPNLATTTGSFKVANGLVPQEFSVYSLDDGANYERFRVWYPSSTRVYLHYDRGGTSQARSMWLVADEGTVVMTSPGNNSQFVIMDSNGTPSFAVARGAARPTCDAGNRFKLWVVNNGTGVADTVGMCTKDANDAYSWKEVF